MVKRRNALPEVKVDLYDSIETSVGVALIKEEIKKLSWGLMPDHLWKSISNKIVDFIYAKREEISDDDLISIMKRINHTKNQKDIFEYFLGKTLELQTDVVGATSSLWNSVDYDKKMEYLKILNKENSTSFRVFEFFIEQHEYKGEFLILQYYKRNHFVEMNCLVTPDKSVACDELNQWVIKRDFVLFFSNGLLSLDEKRDYLKNNFEAIMKKKFNDVVAVFSKEPWILKEFLSELSTCSLENKNQLIESLFDIRNEEIRSSIKKILLSDESLLKQFLDVLSEKENGLSLMQKIIINDKRSFLLDLCLEDEEYFHVLNRPAKIDGVEQEKNLLDSLVEKRVNPNQAINKVYIMNKIKGVKISDSEDNICNFILLSLNSVESDSELYAYNMDIISEMDHVMVREKLKDHGMIFQNIKKDVEIILNKNSMEKNLSSVKIEKVKKIKI